MCNHLFHKSCLREWLVQQQSCPTCRSDIASMQAQEAAAAAAAGRREQPQEEADDEEEVEPVMERPSPPPPQEPEQPQEIPVVPRDAARREVAPAPLPTPALVDEPPAIASTSVEQDKPARSHEVLRLFQVSTRAGVWFRPGQGAPLRYISTGVVVVVTGEEDSWLKIPDGWIETSKAKCVYTEKQ